jgi:predicted nucleic acid-binding protein
MAVVFLDTSALVRRYDPTEPGAAQVRALCLPGQGHTLMVSRFASIEVASAFSRKVREGGLRPDERVEIWHLFAAHWRDHYQVVALLDEVYVQAENLVTQHPLRAIDALQLASALLIVRRLPRQGLQFWTADRQQAAAARGEGLSTQLVS